MNDDRTLVAVFDSDLARLFEYRPTHGKLVPVLQNMKSALDRHGRDIETDKPGRSFSSSGGGVRHSLESRHDPRKLEKHDFVRAISHTIAEALEKHEFGRLAIVAPHRSVGEFRSVASDNVKKALWREIGKELATLTDSELEKHLVPILQSLAE